MGNGSCEIGKLFVVNDSSGGQNQDIFRNKTREIVNTLNGAVMVSANGSGVIIEPIDAAPAESEN